MKLSRTPGALKSGLSRLCCLHKSSKMAAMFRFHRRLRMLDLGSAEDSAISCWESDVIGRPGGYSRNNTEKREKESESETNGTSWCDFVRCRCGGGEMRYGRGQYSTFGKQRARAVHMPSFLSMMTVGHIQFASDSIQ